MIRVLLSFLPMLFSNYRVSWRAELSEHLEAEEPRVVRNTAILVLKEERLLRSENISEMNTPSFDSVAFFFFLYFVQDSGWSHDLLPALLINKMVWGGGECFFGAHIIHFPRRIAPYTVINAINSECLFV